MAKLVNKMIFVGGRYWNVISVNNQMEYALVQEVGRGLKIAISFDEIQNSYEME